MLDVTRGLTKNVTVARKLESVLSGLSLDGSLYIGYPILATADESVTVDALLVTQKHGLVAFLFDDHPPTSDDVWGLREDRQDQLFVAVENSLRRHEHLRRGRRLAVEVQTVMVVDDNSDMPKDLDGEYSVLADVPNILSRFAPIGDPYLKPLQAALQRVATIRPQKKRTGISSPSSKGAILKSIEKEIANLDRWQKSAALESPSGPQRIRGLAGSGKTIVLALKAAYLHAQYPGWTIAVTFWSRALYQQFEDLIRRFSFEHSNDEPNWENLRIIHAWGSRGKEGLYRQIAAEYNLPARDFLYGKSRYGADGAFEGICSELLSAIAVSSAEPMYDAVLIDEAQDLPASFFKIVHKMVRPPKRIVWAYDELQKLSESALPTLEQQFGTDANGKALVGLTNVENAPRQDITLPVCYRNTPWGLALAHGLGLGTSRDEGLVQSFDDPSVWTDIGYKIVDGELTEGSTVTLERAPDSYPSYLANLITQDEAVATEVFTDEQEQARWVAQSIRRNLDEDEIEHDDILIVLPDARHAKSQAAVVLDELRNVSVDGHLAGVTTSQDEIFAPHSVAIANIHRAKGNEAPMVYILNAQDCVARRASGRNILFTAITRSRAWVRICGFGAQMGELQREIESIRNNGYRLAFRLPTDAELAELMEEQRILRDQTADDKAKAAKARNGLEDFLDAADQGVISVDDLPMQVRTAAARHFGAPSGDSG